MTQVVVASEMIKRLAYKTCNPNPRQFSCILSHIDEENQNRKKILETNRLLLAFVVILTRKMKAKKTPKD